jgi:two-component system OmpR family response regulator
LTIRRCALVEDDAVFLKMMHDFFEKKAWVCDEYSDVAAVLEGVKATVYDLYIVDINLPESDGIALVKELRVKYPQVPIIMVSSYNDIDTIMQAYEVGCDEYLKKPFDLRELEIKVKKLMNDERLRLSDTVEYDVSDRTLYVEGKAIHLSQKESNLLHLFMTNINRPLTHEYLESVIWGGIDDNGHALRNLVLRLRKRIGTGLIDTVQGKGYILRLGE